MPGRDIVVIGASAGGVEALIQLVKALPDDLPAALFVVLHFPPDGTSVLPQILRRHTSLKVAHADDGEKIVHGRIYVASPDRHLLIKRGHIHVARGPRENGHRPAVDPLFRTAALAYGPRVIGVILSGTLDDGTAGLLIVKRRGGLAVVQDPEDALYAGMPRSAIENVEVDTVAPLSELPMILTRLVHETVEETMPSSSNDDTQQEADMAELDIYALQDAHRPGVSSVYGCPDCGGVLWEFEEGDLTRYRCRVGHAYSANALLSRQSANVENAMWAALRALEESAALSHRLRDRAMHRDHHLAARRFEEQRDEARQRASVIRDVLLDSELTTRADVSASDPENDYLNAHLDKLADKPL